MKANKSLFYRFSCVVLCVFCLHAPLAQAVTPAPLEGFVETNGVRLEYLDWGGTGPALIYLHGLADSPRTFDDLAPAFTDRFHVIACARRGSGNSDVRGPYDVATLIDDLGGLMDALKIDKAILVGQSAGGDEITEMAAVHPDRVIRIVYLDAAYDLADPDFKAAVQALPTGFFNPPAGVTASFDAYRAYQARLNPSIDISLLEASLRDRVIVHSNGTVALRTPKPVIDALYAAAFDNKGRKYAQVQCPALAIFAEHLYDWNVADPVLRNSYVAYEQKYWGPWQRKSLDRVRRELHNVEIAQVPGAHGTFIFSARERVVAAMRRFLGVDVSNEQHQNQAAGTEH